MKTFIFSFAILAAAFIPLDETVNSDFDASEVQEVVTIDNMDKAISADTFVNPCSDAIANNSDTCSCIASGNCQWDPTASGCYIIFCDGTVVEDPTNAKASNVTKVTVPCEN